MTKNIAVKGCTLSLSVGVGTVSITSPESTSVKFDGKGCYSGPLNVSVSNFADTTTQIVQGAGVGVINPTGTKVKVGGNFVVLEGDSCDVTVTGINSASGSPLTQLVNVKITNTGQTKGVAE